MTAKSIAIKARGGRSGGCAVKAVDPTLRDLRGVRKPGLNGPARAVIAARKSTEGIVAGLLTKARTMVRAIRTVRSCGPGGRRSSWNWPWGRRRRVKPEAPGGGKEARDRSPHGVCRPGMPGDRAGAIDQGGHPARQSEEGAGTCPAQPRGARRRRPDGRWPGRSPERPLARDQVPASRWHVRTALGAAGGDTEGIGGARPPGVPTVLDRFIQQAVLQVLQGNWDEGFSDASYGFRCRRTPFARSLQVLLRRT